MTALAQRTGRALRFVTACAWYVQSISYRSVQICEFRAIGLP
jgi:hypothetical protein